MMENNRHGNAFNLPPNLLKYVSASGLRDKMGKPENQHQPLTDVGRLASSIGMSGPTPKARFAEAVAQSQQIPNHIYAPDGRVGGVQNPFDPMVEPGLPNPTRGSLNRANKLMANLDTFKERGKAPPRFINELNSQLRSGAMPVKPTIQAGPHASKTRWGMEFLPYKGTINIPGMEGPEGLDDDELERATAFMTDGKRTDPLTILAGKAKMAPILDSRRGENSSKAHTSQGSEMWIPMEEPYVTNDLPPSSGSAELSSGARRVTVGGEVGWRDGMYDLDSANMGRGSAYDVEGRGGNMLWHNLLGRGKFPGGGRPVLDSGSERTAWGQGEEVMDLVGGLGGMGSGESDSEATKQAIRFHGLRKFNHSKFKKGKPIHKLTYSNIIAM